MRYFVPFSVLLYSLALPSSADRLEDLQHLVAQKQFSAAIRSGEELLARNTQSPRVKFLTAYAYQMSRRYDKAEVLYRQLISEHPDLPEPRNNLAMIYQHRGDHEAAGKLLVEAIETHKSYATAFHNLNRIYEAIASEAYRRALSESSEPARYRLKIQLSALNHIESLADFDADQAAASPTRAQIPTLDIETVLTQQVKQWARAWSEKDFSAYTSYYSSEHHPNFTTHSAWVEHRRSRVMRPGFINIDVSDMQFRALNPDRAVIDFKQRFVSPDLSDEVLKRLEFRRFENNWKIVDEKVLAVLWED